MVCTYMDEEIITFLDFIVDTESFRRIDGKQQTNITIFNMLAVKVYENQGATKWETKTGTQWRMKWKVLKSKYLQIKTSASKSGAPSPTWRFYGKMQDVMGHRPIASQINADLDGIDRQAIEEPEDDENESIADRSSELTWSPPVATQPVPTPPVPTPRGSKSRKRTASEDTDFDGFLKEMRTQSKEDMAMLSQVIARSNQTMLQGISSILSNFMQPNVHANMYPPNYTPMAAPWQNYPSSPPSSSSQAAPWLNSPSFPPATTSSSQAAPLPNYPSFPPATSSSQAAPWLNSPSFPPATSSSQAAPINDNVD